MDPDQVFKESATVHIGKEAKLDDNGVLKNVHLIGLIGKANRFGDSKTPYTYSEEAIRKAVEGRKYDSVNVFLGHGVGDEPRNPKDRIGVIIPSSVKHRESVGAVGDIQLDTAHPFYGSVKWWAANYPDKLMMSHEAALRYRKDINSVVEITSVDSVDFVIDGNTTTALFKEGAISDRMASNDANTYLQRLLDTVSTLLWAELYPMTNSVGRVLTNKDKATNMLPVAKDLVKELQTLISSKEGATRDDMDITKLTLAELASLRPDLVSAIGAEAVAREAAVISKVDEAVADIPVAHRTALFLGLVRESVRKNDVASTRALVEDRKALLVAQPVSTLATESVTKVPAQQTEAPKLPTLADLEQAVTK